MNLIQRVPTNTETKIVLEEAFGHCYKRAGYELQCGVIYWPVRDGYRDVFKVLEKEFEGA
jgi:hypothetical protein